MPDEYIPAQLMPLSIAYATAILAVAAPAIMQLLLTLDKMAILVGCLLIILTGTAAYNAADDMEGFWWLNSTGIFGLFIATFAWWLANGADDLFQDRPKNNSGSGGDVERQLSGGKRGVTL